MAKKSCPLKLGWGVTAMTLTFFGCMPIAQDPKAVVGNAKIVMGLSGWQPEQPGWCPVFAIRFFDNDAKVATLGPKGINIWDAKTGQPLAAFALEDVFGGTFSTNCHYGVQIVKAREVVIQSLKGAPQQTILRPDCHSIICAAVSEDGERVLIGGREKDATSEIPTGYLGMWDVRNQKELQTFVGHVSPVSNVKFCPDGKHVVSSSFDKTLRLWAIESGIEIRRNDEKPYVSSQGARSPIAFSRAGKQFFVGRTLWDFEAWKPGRRLQATESDTWSAPVDYCFSPSGSTVASAGLDGYIRIWDLATFRELARFPCHANLASALCVDFSSDGKYLAAGGSGTILGFDSSKERAVNDRFGARIWQIEKHHK